MTLAKKTARWLVTAVLVLALALTAVFALGTIASAKADGTFTVYFKNTGSWGAVNAYAWTGEGGGAEKEFGDWPGAAMTVVDADTLPGWYKIDVHNGVEKIIFNDGGSNQTSDLDLDAATPFYMGSWSATFPDAEALPVLMSATSSDVAFPNLLASASARTVTVNYYFTKPQFSVSAIEGRFNPTMKLPDGTSVKPTAIALDGNLDTALALDSVSDYLAGTNNVVYFSLNSTGAVSDSMFGVSAGAISGYYLFQATFPLAANADLGEYTFELTGDFAASGLAVVSPVLTASPFYVREAVQVPTAAANLEYNGSAQTGVAGVQNKVTVTNGEKTDADSYQATASLTDTDLYVWSDGTFADKTINWSIATKDVTISFGSASYTSDYGDPLASITFDDSGLCAQGDLGVLSYTAVNSNSEPVTLSNLSPVGTYTLTATASQANANYNVTFGTATYTIEAKVFDIKFQYKFGDSVSWLDLDNGVLVPVAQEPEATTVGIGDAIPAAPAIRWFKTAGFTFGGDAATTYTVAMSTSQDPVLVAEYTYNVGTGDVTGDGSVNVDDIRAMRLENVTNMNYGTLLASAAVAWENRTANGTFFHVAAADVNGSGSFNSADIVRVREALATGYGYYIVTGENVTGQEVLGLEFVEVDTLQKLINAVNAGKPAKLTQNITEEAADFDLTIHSSAYIDLNGHTLTVNEFSLATPDTGATLRIENGTIYTIEDITISAPNGNVRISAVEGYHYEGQAVNLAAYSSSLHIEGNVAFYTYKINGYDTAQDVKDAIEDTSLEVAQVTAAQESAAQAVAEAKQAVEDATEQEKETKVAELKALAAPVVIPADTHVVVESGANLVVEKIDVQATAGVTTFTIDVKNENAILVNVDATNADIAVVNIAGEDSKVEVAGDALILDNTKNANVATIDEFLAAIQNKVPSVVLIDDITTNSNKPVRFDYDATLYLNGKTFESTNDVAIRVIGGASLTIEGNGDVVAREGCVMAFDGSSFTINGGEYTCTDNFVFGTNGTEGRGNNTITINAGVFNGEIESAGYVACGVYVANSDLVTINGGTFNVTDGCGVLARSGNTTVGENVVFNVTGDNQNLGKVGDSRVVIPAGEAIVLDLKAAYPGGVPTINNNNAETVYVVVDGTYTFANDDASFHAARGVYDNVILTGDFDDYLYVTKDMNVYLNGHTVDASGTKYVAIYVVEGATLTINGEGNVIAKEGCVMTFSGSNLVINGGTYTCTDNFVIGMNGSSNQGGNTITINGGTFNGSIMSAGYIACGIYVSNTYNVYVNGGTFNITDGCGILARSGNTVVSDAVVFNILTDDDTLTAGKVGDSAVQVPTGEALVQDFLAAYPGGEPTITNNSNYTVTVLE